LNVVVRPMGGKGMAIKPTVLKVDENRELRWRGSLLNGLFSGEHSFIIQGVSEGKVRFMHSESFKGVLAPLMWPIIRKSTRRGFEAMNEALRDRAEGKAPSADSPPEEEPPTETETPS
ncbi:MAG: SRPBCC domain-containing protein, partial [Chloroflexi bacterium]|nr:SRPBCC domain-containing protein [Chloroflexota bacterium]